MDTVNAPAQGSIQKLLGGNDSMCMAVYVTHKQQTQDALAAADVNSAIPHTGFGKAFSVQS